MNKKRELPIAVPEYNTYGHQIITTAVFAANPSLKNWSLNRLPLLRCNPDFLLGLGNSPEVFVSRSGYQDSRQIERKFLSLKFLGNKFHESIRAMIDEDYYVFFLNMDDSLIRKAHKSHENIFFRMGVIYGYDQNEKTYSLLSCDEKQNHKVIKIPQRWLRIPEEEGIDSRMFPTLCAIRPKDITVQLNVREIYTTLKQYLDEAEEKYPPFVSTGKVYGNIVHDYIALYLLYIAQKKISYEQIDTKVFRQVWEHKVGMLERLTVVEDTLHLDHSISDNYRKIVEQAKQMNEQYLSCCQKKNKKMILELRDLLLEFSKKERSLLAAFIIKMEEEL